MSVFVDSSIFLKLFLNEAGADESQRILEMIEDNRVIGYTTPMVLEEITFKLIYSKISEALNTTNIWRIREALKLDEKIRSECIKLLKKFCDYIEYLLKKGLRIVPVTYDDWHESIDIIRKYGLLPADSIHVAITLKMKTSTIATYDEDFKMVKEVKVTP